MFSFFVASKSKLNSEINWVVVNVWFLSCACGKLSRSWA